MPLIGTINVSNGFVDSYYTLKIISLRETFHRFIDRTLPRMISSIIPTFFLQFQVYLVFRSGGKPPEDSMGLGVKPSGAKFICRSQARPITTNTYTSTATSSNTPLGTNIGEFLFCTLTKMTACYIRIDINRQFKINQAMS